MRGCLSILLSITPQALQNHSNRFLRRHCAIQLHSLRRQLRAVRRLPASPKMIALEAFTLTLRMVSDKVVPGKPKHSQKYRPDSFGSYCEDWYSDCSIAAVEIASEATHARRDGVT